MKNMSFKKAYILARATGLLLFALYLLIDAFIFSHYNEHHLAYSRNLIVLGIFFVTPLLFVMKASSEAFKKIHNRTARLLLRIAFVVINVIVARLIIGIGGLIYVCEMGIDCF